MNLPHAYPGRSVAQSRDLLAGTLQRHPIALTRVRDGAGVRALLISATRRSPASPTVMLGVDGGVVLRRIVRRATRTDFVGVVAANAASQSAIRLNGKADAACDLIDLLIFKKAQRQAFCLTLGRASHQLIQLSR